MRFSVIIPVYNKGPYIKKALESVMGQSFRDFELVVVDDGSADDSYAVAKSVLDDSSIKYLLLRQENAGVSTARNNGVAASSGDYICFWMRMTGGRLLFYKGWISLSETTLMRAYTEPTTIM